MMHSPTSIADSSEQPYVSTGHLPEPERVQRLVTEAHARFKSNIEGENSQVYPALARMPGDLFGVCVAGISGRVYAAGGIGYPFAVNLMVEEQRQEAVDSLPQTIRAKRYQAQSFTLE
jgi:hypothetical protein